MSILLNTPLRNLRNEILTDEEGPITLRRVIEVALLSPLPGDSEKDKLRLYYFSIRIGGWEDDKPLELNAQHTQMLVDRILRHHNQLISGQAVVMIDPVKAKEMSEFDYFDVDPVEPSQSAPTAEIAPSEETVA